MSKEESIFYPSISAQMRRMNYDKNSNLHQACNDVQYTKIISIGYWIRTMSVRVTEKKPDNDMDGPTIIQFFITVRDNIERRTTVKGPETVVYPNVIELHKDLMEREQAPCMLYPI